MALSKAIEANYLAWISKTGIVPAFLLCCSTIGKVEMINIFAVRFSKNNI
jgi:hypothetical protein